MLRSGVKQGFFFFRGQMSRNRKGPSAVTYAQSMACFPGGVRYWESLLGIQSQNTDNGHFLTLACYSSSLSLCFSLFGFFFKPTQHTAMNREGLSHSATYGQVLCNTLRTPVMQLSTHKGNPSWGSNGLFQPVFLPGLMLDKLGLLIRSCWGAVEDCT